jgi:hypothetical protein
MEETANAMGAFVIRFDPGITAAEAAAFDRHGRVIAVAEKKPHSGAHRLPNASNAFKARRQP